MRCNELNENHPGIVGSQKVTSRNNNTDDTARPPGTPAAVRPADRAASTAPRPPGVGAAWPIVAPAR